MYTAVHRPSTVQIEQGKLPDGADAPDIFTLGLVHQPGGAPQTFHGVYVPKSLQAALFANEVLGLQMAELGSSGACALPFSPNFLAFAVRTRAGETLTEIPKRLRRAFWWTAIRGGVFSVAGAMLMFSEEHLFGTFLLVAGTHSLRSAKGMLMVPALEELQRMRGAGVAAERPTE
jgi:hypothetical protein